MLAILVCVDDTSAPVPPADGATNVECLTDAVTPATPADVIDNCGSTITPSNPQFTDNITSCGNNGTRTYTWDYEDCSGNISQYSFVYTIQDNTAPVPPTDGAMTVQCLTDATTPLTPSDVTDNCGDTVSPTFIGLVDAVDACGDGTRTYTWEYQDCSNNIAEYDFVYTIDDTTAPVPPTDGAMTVECLSDAVLPATPGDVTDNCGATITASNPQNSDNIDACDNGMRTYTWDYVDCSGNVGTYSYVYTILDVTAPVAPDDSGATSTAECAADATAPAAPADVTDNCGGTVSPSSPVMDDSGLDACGNGDRTWTWTYTDCTGNSDTYVHTR